MAAASKVSGGRGSMVQLGGNATISPSQSDVVRVGPTMPNDELQRVRVYVNSFVTIPVIPVSSNDTFTVAVYATRTRPANATEAALGRRLLSATLPNVITSSVNDGAGAFVHYGGASYVIPAQITLEQGDRFLTAVVTAGTLNQIMVSAWFDLYREVGE